MNPKIPRWRQLMADVKALREAGQASLYDRVKKLIEIYEDQEFRDDCARTGQNPEDRVNAELSDTGQKFDRLCAMIRRFPNKDDWKKGDIEKLAARAALMDQEERRGPRLPETPKPAKTKTPKQEAAAAKRDAERSAKETALAKQRAITERQAREEAERVAAKERQRASESAEKLRQAEREKERMEQQFAKEREELVSRFVVPAEQDTGKPGRARGKSTIKMSQAKLFSMAMGEIREWRERYSKVKSLETIFRAIDRVESGMKKKGRRRA